MKKKVHPADIAAEKQMIDAIRTADHFIASLFRGVGQYQKASAKTVRGALQKGADMERLARTTQRCMIYAISTEGRATFLSAALIGRLLKMQETTHKAS